MDFSIALRDLRKEREVTQTVLAENIGYSQSMVSDWEKGNSQPTLPAIIKIAKFFEVSIDEFLGNTFYGLIPEAENILPEQIKLLEIYKVLGAHERGLLLGYAQALSDKSKSK